jgi:hypothetical protein
MSTNVALGQYRVTHVRVPRSTDNGLWAALATQVGSPTIAIDSPFRHVRVVSAN